MSADMPHTGHVPEWKIENVEELAGRIAESKVIGILGVRDIPASHLQQMRTSLREVAEIKVVRNNIVRRAIEKCSPEIRQLADYIEDQTALIFTDVTPFKLHKLLEKEKRPMPIRAGASAPNDIVVAEGETSFSPGPIVGNLQNAGIPAQIKGGKVIISKTTVVAREGDTVSSKLADMLKVMEIYPRNVGLELRALYEDGLIFRQEDLAVDVLGILSEMSTCASQAFTIALEIGYVTSSTIVPLLERANSRALNLMVGCAIPVPGMVDQLLIKAKASANALAGIAGKTGEVPVKLPERSAVLAESVEETEETETKEKDAATGLSSLFG
jgi:large subunit ribosomal protein L10